MTPGTGLPFRRLLRLAGLWWRYSNLPPHGRRITLHSLIVLLITFRHEPHRRHCFPASQLNHVRYPLSSNGLCLQNYYLATGLHATIFSVLANVWAIWILLWKSCFSFCGLWPFRLVHDSSPEGLNRRYETRPGTRLREQKRGPLREAWLLIQVVGAR
jgi:hypothetical protein